MAFLRLPLTNTNPTALLRWGFLFLTLINICVLVFYLGLQKQKHP